MLLEKLKMKPKIIILFVLLFSLLFDDLAEAEMDWVDSLTVSDSIRQQMSELDPETDLSKTQIIRVYNTSIHFAFKNAEKIEDAFPSGEILCTYYVAVRDEKVIMTAIENEDRISLVQNINIASNIFETLSNEYLNFLLNQKVNVYGIYLLWGEPSMSGTAICYLTDNGEYVYYTHTDYKGKEYLFPVSEFCEYQKSILNAKKTYANRDGGIDMSTVSDISKFDISYIKEANIGDDVYNNSADESDDSVSKKRNVLIISLCAGIVIAGLIIAFLIKGHQKE